MKLLLAGLLSGRQSLAQIVLWGKSLSDGGTLNITWL